MFTKTILHGHVLHSYWFLIGAWIDYCFFCLLRCPNFQSSTPSSCYTHDIQVQSQLSQACLTGVQVRVLRHRPASLDRQECLACFMVASRLLRCQKSSRRFFHNSFVVASGRLWPYLLRARTPHSQQKQLGRDASNSNA